MALWHPFVFRLAVVVVVVVVVVLLFCSLCSTFRLCSSCRVAHGSSTLPSSKCILFSFCGFTTALAASFHLSVAAALRNRGWRER